eukprot:GSA25T00025343001.1
MHPTWQRLQREIFRDYRDVSAAAASISASGSNVLPLLDACWIRAPGA